MIEKVDLKSGEVIAKEAAFHSKTEVNLESTNSNELFSKMTKNVFESLAKFQNKDVTGDSVMFLSMDIHTVPLIFRFQRF